jgi:hypothetical protein
MGKESLSMPSAANPAKRLEAAVFVAPERGPVLSFDVRERGPLGAASLGKHLVIPLEIPVGVQQVEGGFLYLDKYAHFADQIKPLSLRSNQPNFHLANFPQG